MESLREGGFLEMTAHLSFSGFEEQKPKFPWLFKNLKDPGGVDQVSFCLAAFQTLNVIFLLLQQS